MLAATSNPGQGGSVLILRGDGLGGFTTQSATIDLAFSELVAGDLDGDGKTDLTVFDNERKQVAARRQGYQVISIARLVAHARSAGLHIIQEESGFTWSIDGLSGVASDVLDAIGLALHCLTRERIEVHK